MEGEMLYKLPMEFLEGGVRQKIILRSMMHIPKAACGSRVNFVFAGEQSSAAVPVNVREASCDVFLNIMSVALQVHHRQFEELTYEELIDNEKYKLSTARATLQSCL